MDAYSIIVSVRRGIQMARVKYNRISSKTQHLDRQEADNQEYDKVFTDIASGKNTERTGNHFVGILWLR